MFQTNFRVILNIIVLWRGHPLRETAERHAGEAREHTALEIGGCAEGVGGPEGRKGRGVHEGHVGPGEGEEGLVGERHVRSSNTGRHCVANN